MEKELRIMKKKTAWLLCLLFLAGLCGTAFAEFEPQGLPLVYPLTTDKAVINKAEPAPEACFTSFASENGLENLVCSLVGKVIRVEDFEGDGKQYHTFVLQTEYGYADIMDIYAFSQEYYPEDLRSEGFESDYSFPEIDEFVKVIVVYSGYSDRIQMPFFYYWTPELMGENTESIEPQEPTHTPTTGESNAVRKAKSYLGFTAFSRKGLIEQLEYEGFSHDQAVYAADNCGADWFKQAAKKAESYLGFMALSRNGLIEQLEYEGFTHEQAVYGVEQNGY